MALQKLGLEDIHFKHGVILPHMKKKHHDKKKEIYDYIDKDIRGLVNVDGARIAGKRIDLKNKVDKVIADNKRTLEVCNAVFKKYPNPDKIPPDLDNIKRLIKTLNKSEHAKSKNNSLESKIEAFFFETIDEMYNRDKKLFNGEYWNACVKYVNNKTVTADKILNTLKQTHEDHSEFLKSLEKKIDQRTKIVKNVLVKGFEFINKGDVYNAERLGIYKK